MNRTKTLLKTLPMATLLTTVWLSGTPNALAAGSSSLVIAEVYGGGGNSGAPYKNDFIVVFNRGTSDVDVNGWSVQYASASGTSWQVTPLATASKVIPAGGYFLVQEAAGTGSAASLPAPDATGTINMSGTAGKVALVNNATALTGGVTTGTGPTIVDFVGFGSANAFEGSGPTTPPSNSTSVQRNNSGCSDSDDNANDFTAAAPNPRNSASPTHSCAVVTPPTISGIVPGSLTTNAGNAVSFTVTLSAGDAPLTYYWYQGAISPANLVATTDNGTLTLPNVIAANSGDYQVVVSNASTLTDTSSVVSLSVIDPGINSQPAPSQTLLQNSTARFTFNVGGTPTVTYQWYSGAPGSSTALSDGGRISGATSSTLSIASLTAGDAGTYFAIAQNGLGSVTSSVVTLNVVATGGTIAYWDFNAPFDPNAPASTMGAGTASVGNAVPFVLPSSSGDGNDFGNADAEGYPNNGWGTSTYPAAGASNLTAGVQFNVSTVGAKNIRVSYDTRGTATTSKYTRLQYTTNGTDFVNYPASSSFTAASTFQTQTYNLSGFAGVANNPNFGIRVVTEFVSTATYGVSNSPNYIGITSSYGTGGTLSYDMVSITGDSILNGDAFPTIGAIPDLTILDRTSTNITISVGGGTGALTVTATSLNQSILSDPFASGNTLTLSPMGVDGVAPVVVTVTDSEGNTASTSFNVTTVPQNQAPTITGLVSTNTLANTPITLPFVVGDDHTAPSGLTISGATGNSQLINNISFGGSAANRTVTITPTPGQLGVAPITVTLSDNDPNSPQSTSLSFTLMVRPNTNVVFNDYMDYDNSGSLVSLSGGLWQNHSGTAGQLQVGSGVATIDGVNHSEDVNALLIGAPYNTNTPTVLYSSMTINYSTLPTLTGAYFTHFKDTNTGAATGFGARVWASTTNAASGAYRLSIANGADGSNTTAQLPVDLYPGSNYVIVTRFVVSNGFSTLWVNPTSESSPSVTDPEKSGTNGINVVAIALRESNNDEGTLTVDNVKVGLSFADVVDILSINSFGSNVVVKWGNPTYSLQSSTSVTGPYTTIPGATSPYTNNSASPTTFYRLIH